jgi:hypothetical protein
MDFEQINENFTFRIILSDLCDSGHRLHLPAMPYGSKASSGLKLTIRPPVKAQSHMIHAPDPVLDASDNNPSSSDLDDSDTDTGSDEEELTDGSQDDKSDEEGEEVQRLAGPVKKTRTRGPYKKKGTCSCLLYILNTYVCPTVTDPKPPMISYNIDLLRSGLNHSTKAKCEIFIYLYKIHSCQPLCKAL